MNYQHKYSKYKNKYLKLKSIMQFGGNDFKKTIDNFLNSNKSFIFINIGLTDEEIQLINSIKINFDIIKKNNLSYAGVYYNYSLYDLIYNFILHLGNEEKESHQITHILITKVIEPYLKAMNHTSLWFEIRIMNPINEFEIPRWHIDGFFYKANEYTMDNKLQQKLAGIFYGPGTLFKKHDDVIVNKYLELYRKLYKNFDRKQFNGQLDMENRKIIAEQLSQYEEVQPSNNEIAIFIVGDEKRSAVHSEPNMTTNRFFYSIVSGDKEDIKELARNRGLEFKE